MYDDKNMKKYYQLLLLIVSVISLTLLLVYRHEYNKLHYVLEVFNFFGQPCNFSDLQLSDGTLNNHDWGPIPLWQESENTNFYSAFWTKQNEVKALVLQPTQNELARSCYIWVEDSAKPVMGKFKLSKISRQKQGDQSAYFYYCTLGNVKHVPYAVSFSVKKKKAEELKKILLTNTVKHRKSTINTTICVSPTVFNKANFIEFISYHKLIGIDSYIFYTDSVPHRLAQIITNLSAKLGIKVTFFPWNLPSNNQTLTRTIVENDCILRTMNLSKNAVTLEVNEYLVPVQHYTFNEIISDYDAKYMSERLSLPVQVFCVKHTDHRKPLVLQNTQVSYDNNKDVRYIYRNNHDDNIVATQAIIKGVASVHKYVHCTKDTGRVYHDKTILRFATDLTRSTLVQLLFHDQI